MKKITIFIGFLVFSVLLVPVLSVAQGGISRIEFLRNEISQLEAKLAEYRKELAGLEGQGGVWCHTFNTDLRVGDKGAEVKALIDALGKENLMQSWGGRIYEDDWLFQERTASVVTAFQEKYRDEILKPVGLTNGTGYVGKSTRAKLNALYACKKPISVNTIEVKTPGQFTLTPNMIAKVVNWQDTSITLKSVMYTKIVCITTPCVSPIFALISLDSPGGCGVKADPRCLGPPSYHQDFNLRIGETVEAGGLPITAVNILQNQVTFKIGKEDSTTNQPPVIRGVSGPTNLTTGEIGNWTVEAYDPERASLRHAVLWGDEKIYPVPSAQGYDKGATNSQKATFLHSYSKAGAYIVTFTVSDNAGQSVRSTITVNVSDKMSRGYLYLKPESINLKVGEIQGVGAYYQPAMPTCPTGLYCAQVMPAPYRVDAQFTTDQKDIINFIFALPVCIPNEIQDGYCSTLVSVEGKSTGTAKVTAYWSGLIASMEVRVQ